MYLDNIQYFKWNRFSLCHTSSVIFVHENENEKDQVIHENENYN